MTKEILQKAKDENLTPALAAMEVADRLSRVDHPIWPQRSLKIIKALVKSEWHQGNDFWRQ